MSATLKPKWPFAGNPVLVEWYDSFANGGWSSRDLYLERTKTACCCRSVGWLLRNDRHAITLIQSQIDTGDMRDSMTIPRACVKRIRRVK